jgi:alpha-1,4-digalacturonate transport system substrate-binding protein
MPSPSGKAGRSAILDGSGLAIPQNAPGKDLALDFVRWLYANPKNFQDYLALDKGMSSLKAVSYTPSNAKIATDYQVTQAEVSNVSPLFGVDESSSWRNYKDNEYRNYRKQAVNGYLTPSAALTGFAKELSESSKWAIR